MGLISRSNDDGREPSYVRSRNAPVECLGAWLGNRAGSGNSGGRGVLYVTQRDRSQRLAFQALQAAVYQFAGLLITIVLWVLWGIFYAVSWIPLMQDPAAFEDALPPLFIISLASMVIPFTLMMFWGLYSLLGAVQVLRGRISVISFLDAP